jgi:hypothetical protein
MYYIFVEDGKLNGAGEGQLLNDNVINYEVDEELYNSYLENKDLYIWDGLQVVINPNYEQEQELKERERIARLNLTGADVERGIYKAKGMDFEDILDMVKTLQPEGLDIKALKIELKANNFYRGNPYVDAVGALLGFTSEQLDKFFETNDYTNLLA